MRFYRALLHLFPRSFRAEYGAEMSKDFAREWNTAHGFAALGLILTTLGDVVGNAMRVHADILVQDVRYAVRSLRRTPGFTITAILVAALGIGATTATFSIADHVLLRPLPFADPDRLVRLTEDHTSIGYPRMEPSPPNYQDWKRMATALSIEAFNGDARSLVGSGEPERIVGATVGGGVFSLLGRQAAIGRTLSERDAADETQNPVVISDRTWRTRFAADPNVLGRALTLDNTTLVIVGVMPPDFFFPTRDTEYWRLQRFSPANGDDRRGNNYLQVMARLKPGVTFEQARAEMRTIADQIAQQFPKEQAGKSVNVNLWRDDVNRQIRLMLWALVGRGDLPAADRLHQSRQPAAVARALEADRNGGAHRGRRQRRSTGPADDDRQPVAGGRGRRAWCGARNRRRADGGPAGADGVTDRRRAARRLPNARGRRAHHDRHRNRLWRDAGAAHVATYRCLGAEGGRSRRRHQPRHRAPALVAGVAEIVASVVLLVSAGLLIQALLKVQAIDPGFRSENVLTLKTNLPRTKYPLARREQFYRQVIADTLAVPGVLRAAYISFTPFTMRGGMWEILTTTPDPTSLGGFAAPPDVQRAALRFVTPGYFETIGIPILQGRDVSRYRYARHDVGRGGQRVVRAAAIPRSGSDREIVRVRGRDQDDRRRRRRHPLPRTRTKRQRAAGLPGGIPATRWNGRSSIRRRI